MSQYMYGEKKNSPSFGQCSKENIKFLARCCLREALTKKKNFLSGIARITSPPPPNLGNLYHFFWTSKTTFLIARITEQSKDDYDNDVSDNCDHNFGTFDDFGVKNDQKVSKKIIKDESSTVGTMNNEHEQ